MNLNNWILILVVAMLLTACTQEDLPTLVDEADVVKIATNLVGAKFNHMQDFADALSIKTKEKSSNVDFRNQTYYGYENTANKSTLTDEIIMTPSLIEIHNIEYIGCKWHLHFTAWFHDPDSESYQEHRQRMDVDDLIGVLSDWERYAVRFYTNPATETLCARRAGGFWGVNNKSRSSRLVFTCVETNEVVNDTGANWSTYYRGYNWWGWIIGEQFLTDKTLITVKKYPTNQIFTVQALRENDCTLEEDWDPM